MKNLSLVLILVLFGLVGVLYYFHFDRKSTPLDTVVDFYPKDTMVMRPLKVAYVDLDTIEEKFEYFKQKQATLEKQSEETDKELNSAYNELQREQYQFEQKGASVTQIESEDFQKRYNAELQNLEREKAEKQQDFINEQKQMTDDVLAKIHAFMDEFNKTKHYSFIFSTGKGALMFFYTDTAYNITDEVLAGLNAYIKPGQ